MDFSELFHNKTALIVVGGVVGGAVLFSFLHKGSSSSTTFNPSSGSAASPTQYLVPYNAYFTGAMPDGGSTTPSTPSTPTAQAPSGNWLTNPLGAQPGGAAEQAAFEGTQNYNGQFYNNYNLSTLEANAGPNNWIGLLYPGQDPTKVLPGISIDQQGNTVSVPVYPNEGAIPSTAILSR